MTKKLALHFLLHNIKFLKIIRKANINYKLKLLRSKEYKLLIILDFILFLVISIFNFLYKSIPTLRVPITFTKIVFIFI